MAQISTLVIWLPYVIGAVVAAYFLGLLTGLVVLSVKASSDR